jgi:hypothetical protein
MPPVAAKPMREFDQKSGFGTEFGLFAMETIPKDVFIGEYACDLLNG